jgi:hypothetical protein
LVGADVAESFLDVSLPFSAFKFTALALDRQIFSPSNLVIQVYFNATDNFGWCAKSLTVPTTTPTSLVSVTVNNVSVQLASEQNLTIISKIQQQVMSNGISIPIGYPTTTRQAIASSTAHSYQLNLTKGYGQRILALITAAFSVANVTTPAKNSHIRGTISNYNTFMNNIAEKYANGYDCTLGQDYFFGNREYLEKSTIQSNQEYAIAEWCHISSYFGEKPLHELDMTEIDGYDVGSSASAWQLQATLSTAGVATWVTAIIGQKMLTLSSQGSMVA